MLAINPSKERKTTMDEPMDDATMDDENGEPLNPELDAALETLVEEIERCRDAVGLRDTFNPVWLMNAEGFGNITVGTAGTGDIEVETLPREENEAWPIWRVMYRVRDAEADIQLEEELIATADTKTAAKRAVMALLERRLDHEQ
jgi:hypothetical protein